MLKKYSLLLVLLLASPLALASDETCKQANEFFTVALSEKTLAKVEMTGKKAARISFSAAEEVSNLDKVISFCANAWVKKPAWIKAPEFVKPATTYISGLLPEMTTEHAAAAKFVGSVAAVTALSVATIYGVYRFLKRDKSGS